MKFLRAALSRRAALGRLIGGAVTAPMLAPTLAEAEKSWAIRSVVSGNLNNMTAAAPVGGASADWTLQKPIRDLLRRNEIEANHKIAHRLGSFDSDIACLNSVAYGQRVRMQRDRDRVARSFIDELRRQLGWD